VHVAEPEACAICEKHRGEGPLGGELVVEDEYLLAFHAPASAEEPAYLGYLFVETRRHVAELGDLTDEEAAALGRLVARLSSALVRAGGADHVYAAVIGDRARHFHLHLVGRHPGTPPEYWWTRVDEWPGAPRGDPAEVVRYCARLREALA
jgi:diadenosine tetraphosphate (Ap4A) HIT family hydrolase